MKAKSPSRTTLEDSSNRRPPTKKQLVALWHLRLRDLRRVTGQLHGIQECIHERTGIQPWLPDLPDLEAIGRAMGDGMHNIDWLEPSAEEVSRGTLLKAEIARSQKRSDANVHYLPDRSPQKPR